MSTPFILASGSPRRKDLLASLGLAFECEIPRIPETRRQGESPVDFALRLAEEKAAVVSERIARRLPVLAADTVVFIGQEILDKPSDQEDAARILRTLSGVTHEVVTGVAAANGSRIHRSAVVTRVRFRELEDAEIRWYCETGEPMDKAGAYAIQGIGNFLVESIDGSPSNVIGLPLAEALGLLAAVGVSPPWRAAGSRNRLADPRNGDNP